MSQRGAGGGEGAYRGALAGRKSRTVVHGVGDLQSRRIVRHHLHHGGRKRGDLRHRARRTRASSGPLPVGGTNDARREEGSASPARGTSGALERRARARLGTPRTARVDSTATLAAPPEGRADAGRCARRPPQCCQMRQRQTSAVTNLSTGPRNPSKSGDEGNAGHSPRARGWGSGTRSRIRRT